MIRLFGRSLLSLLVVLQAVQPALACNCEVMIDDSCGCATECGSCEPVAIESEPCDACGAEVEPSPCGCEGEASESATEPEATSDEAPKPQAAETNKPKTYATPADEKPSEASPSIETPAPELETPTTALPAAPINVPSESVATPSNTEVFPGPAPVESAPAQDPAVTPPTDSGNLFDEPAPVATPTDSTPPAATTPAVEDTVEEKTVTEDLFVEPSQPATDPDTSEPAPVEEVTETETETTESESTEEPATESDPLDELFGPATPATDPASQSSPETESNPETQPEPEAKPETEDADKEKAVDPFDPFGQLELPSELRAPGGLASGEFRNWSNRAASFRCDARLVRLTTDGVFLAQPSGELVAMSFSQLSDADLSFVRAQVRAQRIVLARAANTTQLAARTAQ